MTAAELIVLLHAHPKTCERLGITIGRRMGIRWAMTDEGDLGAFEDSDQMLASRLRLWVRGAASEWCEQHDVVVDREATEHRMYYWFSARTLRSDPHAYDTWLGAAFAAMEAHDG